MPAPGPSVLPQYYGTNMGDKIAQALQQKQAFDRQRDLDAVETGVGLQRYDPADPSNAPAPAFGDRIRSALSKVGMGSDPLPAQRAQWNMGVHTPQVGITANGPGGANPTGAGDMAESPAGYPDRLRLPSGQVVDTMFTPFGQRMQQAALQRQFNMAMLGIRGDQRMQQIGAQGENSANTANIRVGGTLGAANIRAGASIQNHNTATPFQVFREQNPLPVAPRASAAGPMANAPGSVGALTHVVAADRASVADLNNTMTAARAHPPSGRAILRANPQADTTAVLGQFRSDTTATRGALDAARSRLQQHTAQLGQAGAGGPAATPTAPAPLRALTAQEQAAAKSDPGFATFLSQKGYKAGQDY